MKKLAAEYAFHPTHIIRCVKKKYGISPLQLLLNIRINKAKELLVETNHTISQIGMEVGFEDNAYFTKQFKKIVQQTPTEYRNQFRNKK